MKNVTITLPEDTLAKVRVEAARAGKSMSKYLAGLIDRQVAKSDRSSDIEAIERFLAAPYWDLTDENGNAPSRDQIYDR